MSNTDRRPVAEGGGGQVVETATPFERSGFIQDHGLWDEADHAAAAQLWRVIDELGIELVRFAFVDQHGLVRGKTLTRQAVAAALRSGVTAPSSLLLKDTSGQSVFSVFSADPGVGAAGFSGAGDMLMVPDPTTFRVLPWAADTAWILCDLHFPDGSAVPFCTRSILAASLKPLAQKGLSLVVGVELEFHVFRDQSIPRSVDHVGRPGSTGPQEVLAPVTAGSQLLLEETLDDLDDLVQEIRSGLTGLDLPLRSIELEFGPGQLEITLAPSSARSAADAVVLCRTAVRQISRRNGFHATFMSRPAGAQMLAAGWHLHQSLTYTGDGSSAFAPPEGAGPLARIGRQYMAGILEHACAAAAFATPTVNGYKRYQAYSLAPDRVLWGVDNKGAMVRAIGRPADPASRLENRSGEPAANPYLYIASQVISGLDGLARELDPGPPTEDPYQQDARRLPASLGDALDELDRDRCFRAALGDSVVDWYLGIKRAEFNRYLLHVSDWEHREYFELF